MKWTEQHTLKFLQEYLKYECLYNVKCAEFKNKQLRDAALLKLSEAMAIPDFGPKEAYNKIRSLKSNFSQEHKKVKDSIKSGAGLDDIYVPNIKWYKLMDDALKAVNVGECRETSSNMVSIFNLFFYWLSTVCAFSHDRRYLGKHLEIKNGIRVFRFYTHQYFLFIF